MAQYLCPAASLRSVSCHQAGPYSCHRDRSVWSRLSSGQVGLEPPVIGTGLSGAAGTSDGRDRDYLCHGERPSLLSWRGTLRLVTNREQLSFVYAPSPRAGGGSLKNIPTPRPMAATVVVCLSSEEYTRRLSQQANGISFAGTNWHVVESAFFCLHIFFVKLDL